MEKKKQTNKQIVVWSSDGLVAKFEEHYRCKLLKYEVLCGPSG
jgi:hypothetical protein